MTDQLRSDGDPRSELSRSRALARRVREAQRATWFPLLLFGIVTILALPLSLAGHIVRTRCTPVAADPSQAEQCYGHNSVTFIYFPIALVLAYVAIAAFYVRRSRARGIGTRVGPYIVVGVVVSMAATIASIWQSHQSPSIREHDLFGWHVQQIDIFRFIAPACAIGLALLVLAAIEHSLALVAVTIAYLVIDLSRFDFGWTITSQSRWSGAPHDVIPGVLLLAAAAGFALVQHSRRRL